MEDKVRQRPELTGYGKGSDIILNTTGSHLRTLVKEARVIVSYFKKMSLSVENGSSKTRVEARPVGCLVPESRGVRTEDFSLKISKSPDGGVEQRQSGERVSLKLLIVHLQKAVYINQGHPEPGPPCKCLNKHFHFQAIEKVKAVSLFNFYVVFHSIQEKRTGSQTSLLNSSAL